MTTTQTEIEAVTVEDMMPYEDTSDPNARTHIVDFLRNKAMEPMYEHGSTAQDIVDMARMFGTEVLALCGYRWVPVHNPQKYPECKRCFGIMRNMK